ncbi:MAG: DODA-type extradiol aromatic ring-opening family dioxygenase [Xanthobacteraceae bacterium]
MAEIVFGFGTSHGPLLATPPHEWDLRANVDRKNKGLAFGAGTYDFESLYKLRKNDHFEKQNTLEVRAERNDRCQKQLDILAERLRLVNPDALVIVGDDHHEWFLNDIQPAFSIFHGKEVFNRALTKTEEESKIANGGGYAMKIYYPQKDEIYPCPTDLASHMVNFCVQNDFDVTSLGEQPADGNQLRQLGHSYGFIYRRILHSRPVPLIPILVNTYYPPNQPTPKRCLEFGRALGRAIKSWKGNERVAVVASGGVSHFVVDEAFDRRLLDAMMNRNYDVLTGEPDIHFRSGTSETKNWLVVAGMIAETDLDMELLDYVPCYRSEAGTGSGMAFAAWQ